MDRRMLLGRLLALVAAPSLPAFAASWGAADFAGTWRLARASDGKRSRENLDETLDLRVVADVLEVKYRIADRFGKRALELRAPLDGTPFVQSVQSRRAVVSARMAGEQLVLEIARDAPFGHIHNRRTMRLAADGRSIESHRENYKEGGAPHSAWQETWIRME